MNDEPSYPAWKQALASVFAAVAIGIGLWMRIIGGGWLLIPLLLPYLVFVFFSAYVLFLSIKKHKLAVGLTTASGIASLFAFAFQVDYGDDGPAWFAIAAVSESDVTQRTAVPKWWITNGASAFLELMLFIPAVVLLICILIRKPFRVPERVDDRVLSVDSSGIDSRS